MELPFMAFIVFMGTAMAGTVAEEYRQSFGAAAAETAVRTSRRDADPTQA